MLFQKLGIMKRIWIMTSVIMIVVALVLIVSPVMYIGVLIAALGYAMITASLVIALDFLAGNKALINYIAVAAGLVLGLLGLLVLVKRSEILPTLGLLFGIILLMSGAFDLYSAFIYARRAGSKAWMVLAVLSLITLVCGVILLINMWWDEPAVLKQIIGYMLLFSSVVNIIRVILTWPFKNM